MPFSRVVVTGLGAITPVGNNVKDFWQSLMAGKSGASAIETFDASRFDSRIAAPVKDFDPAPYIPFKEAKRMERFTRFGVAAASQAMTDSGLRMDQEDPADCGVIVGAGIGALGLIEETHSQYLEKGPEKLSPFMIPLMIINMASGWISILHNFRGPNMSVVTACATGTHAIGEAFRIIQHGQAKIMLAGGTEACITPLGIGGFCALRALSKRNEDPTGASRPFDSERDGFVMGEGAGVVMLEELEHAKSRGARIYCELVGYAMNGDAYHMTAPRPDGEGAARCMALALKDAGLNARDVQYINAHGTSTELNDKIETLAIKTVFGDYAKKLAVNSTKSMTGHTLGAAGGIECVAMCLSVHRQELHPTINLTSPDPDCDLDYVPNTGRRAVIDAALSNSLGFGGHNSTLAVRRYKG